MEKYSVRRYRVSPSYIQDLREIFYPLTYYKPRHYKNNSRYTNLRQLRNDDRGVLYHETWNKKYVDESAEDSYYIVTINEENRLDMIANSFYGTPKYWWVIAIANEIIDPFDIPIGTKLRIPPIISLYNKGGILSSD